MTTCETPLSIPLSDADSCEAFCRLQWRRLFAVARENGCSPHDAEDAVQDFFARLVRRGQLLPLVLMPPSVQSSHLLVRMRCHLMNRWRDQHRLRRGGGLVILPLASEMDAVADPVEAGAETGPSLDTRRMLRALDCLRMEMKPQTWSRLSPWLSPNPEACVQQADGATRVALHRARRRLRALMQMAAGFVILGTLSTAAHDAPHQSLSSTATKTSPSTVSITVEGDHRVIRSNGIPDHTPGDFPRRGNPNSISAQKHEFRVPLKPSVASQTTSAQRGWFGVALNGVPFEAGTAEFWSRDWGYEAIGGTMDLGLDEHLAHVQPSGAYHYHGLPSALVSARGGDEKKMLLIGWAADGFPIYTQRAHRKAGDANSPLQSMRPSYQLKSGNRPGGPDGPGGKYDGAFTADYEYVAGSGDLDECNGRTGVTPEFPEGTYYYCLTPDFPFAPRLWRGTPDSSFQKRGGPPGGRRPPPPGGPGGRRPRPPF